MGSLASARSLCPRMSSRNAHNYVRHTSCRRGSVADRTGETWASLALEIKRELTMSDFDADLDDDIGDDLLRLTFVACHPALSTEAAWSV